MPTNVPGKFEQERISIRWQQVSLYVPANRDLIPISFPVPYFRQPQIRVDLHLSRRNPALGRITIESIGDLGNLVSPGAGPQPLGPRVLLGPISVIRNPLKKLAVRNLHRSRNLVQRLTIGNSLCHLAHRVCAFYELLQPRHRPRIPKPSRVRGTLSHASPSICRKAHVLVSRETTDVVNYTGSALWLVEQPEQLDGTLWNRLSTILPALPCPRGDLDLIRGLRDGQAVFLTQRFEFCSGHFPSNSAASSLM